MKSLSRSIAVCTLATALGCADGLGPTDEFQLLEARDTWDRVAISSYTYEYRLSCLCDSPAPEFTRIIVEDGEVQGVAPIENPQAVETSIREQFDDIQGLLDFVDQLLGQQPDAFLATYDQDLGFPTLVSVDLDFDRSGDEFTFEARNLVPNESPIPTN